VKSVHAFTEEVASYPGFLAIVREDGDTYRITVRGRGNNGNSVGSVVCDWNQLLALAADLREEISATPPPMSPSPGAPHHG